MKKSIIISSLILQSFYVCGLVIFIVSLLTHDGGGIPKYAIDSILEILFIFFVNLTIGLVGLTISLRILAKGIQLPHWFKAITKIFSYAWLMFIPIGTILGVIQLRRLRNET